MLTAAIGTASAQPNPNRPVARMLAIEQLMSAPAHRRRGLTISTASRIAVASHRKATPPS